MRAAALHRSLLAMLAQVRQRLSATRLGPGTSTKAAVPLTAFPSGNLHGLAGCAPLRPREALVALCLPVSSHSVTCEVGYQQGWELGAVTEVRPNSLARTWLPNQASTRRTFKSANLLAQLLARRLVVAWEGL
jgi:hypothetical protein